ncbi:MAG: hypothetical protein OXF06_13525, partial [Bacteroidetes bacterium]|nr:hypothetical protein [Bacteroidota bacterium]
SRKNGEDNERKNAPRSTGGNFLSRFWYFLTALYILLTLSTYFKDFSLNKWVGYSIQYAEASELWAVE